MSTASDPEKKELAKRRNAEGEHRLPPAIAVVVAGATHALLLDSRQPAEWRLSQDSLGG